MTEPVTYCPQSILSYSVHGVRSSTAATQAQCVSLEMALSPQPASRLPILATTSSAMHVPPSIPSASLNSSWASPTEPGSLEDMVATGAIGAVLSAMGIVGMVGNAYALVVTCLFLRTSASMHVYIISLALADLLYLLSIPFIMATYVTREWHFGDVGCRVLFSLDFLTMHASIFTLTVMSSERYAAVLRPLDTVQRPKGYRKLLALGMWLLALLLALPMMLAIRLVRRGHKSLCLPAWGLRPPRLPDAALRDQHRGARRGHRAAVRAPGPGLLVVAAGLPPAVAAAAQPQGALPHPGHRAALLGLLPALLAVAAPRAVPRGPAAHAPRHAHLTTCLTYGNSCVNPFLYTLLTKNYRQYRRRSLRPHAPGAHRLAGACSFPQGRVRFQRHQQAAGAITLPQEAPAGGRA